MTSSDGAELWSYLLAEEGAEPAMAPGAVVFSLGGSEGSVLGAMGPMAGFVMMGMRVVLVERRGIAPDGTVDPELLFQAEDKAMRISDTLDIMAAYLTEVAPGTPVLLVGASEGADIGAAVAAADRRVSHLVLLGGGGGLSQADLLSLEIPVFLAQGTADTSVPVESARALQTAFADAGNTNLRYREYPGLDHSFRDPSGNSVLPLIEVDLLVWLRDMNLLSPEACAQHIEDVHSAHPELFP